MTYFYENVFIILVRPQHPGNIGAICRAMKNMGFSKLRIVSAENFDLERARWMAPGSEDVLYSAEYYNDLESALSDINIVVGTTSRNRQWRFPIIQSRQLGHKIIPLSKENKIGILFGQEDCGLDNNSIGKCELLVEIPTHDLKSLNLSQAVLIILYDLMLSRFPETKEDVRALSTFAERHRLVDSLLLLSDRVNYLRGVNLSQMRAFFYGITSRIRIDSREVNLSLGFINKIMWHLENPKQNDSLPALDLENQDSI